MRETGEWCGFRAFWNPTRGRIVNEVPKIKNQAYVIKFLKKEKRERHSIQ